MGKTIIKAKDVVSMSKLISQTFNDPNNEPLIVLDSNVKDHTRVYIIGRDLEDGIVKSENNKLSKVKFRTWLENLSEIENNPHASKYTRLIPWENLPKVIKSCKRKGIRVLRRMKNQGSFPDDVWNQVSKLEILKPNTKSFRLYSECQCQVPGFKYSWLFIIEVGNFSGDELRTINHHSIIRFRLRYSDMTKRNWYSDTKAIVCHQLQSQNQFRHNTKFHEHFEKVIFPVLAEKLRNFKVVGLEEKEVA